MIIVNDSLDMNDNPSKKYTTIDMRPICTVWHTNNSVQISDELLEGNNHMTHYSWTKWINCFQIHPGSSALFNYHNYLIVYIACVKCDKRK